MPSLTRGCWLPAQPTRCSLCFSFIFFFFSTTTLHAYCSITGPPPHLSPIRSRVHESVDRFVGRAEVKLHPVGMQLNLRVAVENLSGNKREYTKLGTNCRRKVKASINRLKALQ